MNLTLHVWRQPSADAPGRMERYDARDISPDMSFLEMLDVVNEGLVEAGQQPIAFDHDCREGICGSCGMMINGVAHGPMKGTATCQLHMRSFEDGATITIEPWRSRAFPVVKDLVVNRERARSDHRGGRIHQRADRRRARREHDPGAEAERRRGDGRRGVHRLRRLRGGVPQRLGVAVHGREDLAPRTAAAGTAGALPARGEDGRADGRGRLRALHAVRRVPGGVPEGDQHRHDRADEPRLSRGVRQREGRKGARRHRLIWLTSRAAHIFRAPSTTR